MQAKNWALEVTGLRKSFGSVVAASNINLKVAGGCIVSIIGTNGAGKTTFINMVTGYLRPDAGTVRMFGLDITGQSPRQIVRAGLGRSFQIPQLFDGISVWENVMTAAILGNISARNSLGFGQDHVAEQRCEEVLTKLGLSDCRQQSPENLPGGTRKLLDIAMALVSEPRLLLLDEPTSGVSEQEKFELMSRVLRAVEGKPMTTILVEHDMEVVRHFSDRVLAFVAGEVVADGSADQVLADEQVQLSITGRV